MKMILDKQVSYFHYDSLKTSTEIRRWDLEIRIMIQPYQDFQDRISKAINLGGWKFSS